MDLKQILVMGDKTIYGGGWSNSAGDCRSACRNRWAPRFRNWDLGFRVCLVNIGQSRVLRGGDWIDFGGGCRLAYRIGLEPGYRGTYVGFRPVLKKI